MHEANGKTILLAQKAGLGEITMCGCGVVSIHLGGITVRLETTALLEMENMIQSALDSMCEIANTTPKMSGVQHVH